mmetsp:Transcript_15617/g.25557  ORF Transcript_15617/g.25557 Transcript_15617/m.25557 type:complete len:209 (+) Transcript_15617:1-627(+)
MGNIFSAIFSPLTIGVGASGGVFGIFGAAWSDLILNYSLYKGRVCRIFVQLFCVTFLNLIVGLIPYVDNFAHIGGLLTGMIAGFGVLVANRYSRYGELKERKRYQLVLQIMSAVLIPVLIVVCLFVLYLGEPGEWCSWCHYMSCVQFPPGPNPWWTCDSCSNVGIQATLHSNGTVTLLCPDGVQVVTPTIPGLATDRNALITLCQNVC